jgi:hypothetical protein
MLLLLHCYLRNGNRSWTNVVYLWIQEKPHREYNNNNGTQIEHWWQVGVPHLYSSWMIINFVLKFMLEIIFVNMTKERKDMVKQKWIWNLNFGRRLMDLEFGYGSILYIYIKKTDHLWTWLADLRWLMMLTNIVNISMTLMEI